MSLAGRGAAVNFFGLIFLLLGLSPAGADSGSASLEAVRPVIAGAEFLVRYRGPNGRYDQVRIVDPRRPDAYFSNMPVSLASAGRVRLVAPEKPGRYEIRYLDQDKRVLAATVLEVRSANTVLSVPARVVEGSRIGVRWRGHTNENDKIQLVSAKQDKMLKSVYAALNKDEKRTYLVAPEKAGDYILRYVSGSGNVLSAKKIRVEPVNIVFDKVRPVLAGGMLSVRWNGPVNKYDRVGIIDPKKPDRELVFTFATRYRSVSLSVPEQPGEYALVYKSRSNRVLASTRFQVLPVSASLKLSKKVRAGQKFHVQWTGPGNQYDQIRIIDPRNNRPLAHFYIRMYNSAKIPMTAPSVSGKYEIQYVTPGKNVLARIPLRVDY